MSGVRELPLTHVSDARIAQGLVEGDARAAAAAWDRFHRLVRGLIRRMLGEDEVEDRVQEVFLRLIRQAKTIQRPEALRSFIVGMTLRVARSELRKRRVRRILMLSSPSEMPIIAHHPDMEAREALRRLLTLLDRLGTEERLAFVLRSAEGMALDEVAQHLGCSLATAKRRILRATDQLETWVQGDAALLGYLRPKTRPEVRREPQSHC
jgi:RNA polymerase sigma-70 factor (ECF subfamily)